MGEKITLFSPDSAVFFSSLDRCYGAPLLSFLQCTLSALLAVSTRGLCVSSNQTLYNIKINSQFIFDGAYSEHIFPLLRGRNEQFVPYSKTSNLHIFIFFCANFLSSIWVAGGVCSMS